MDKQRTKQSKKAVEGFGVEKWPNTIRSREELEAVLEAGRNSGVSKRTVREICEDTISELEHEKR